MAISIFQLSTLSSYCDIEASSPPFFLPSYLGNLSGMVVSDKLCGIASEQSSWQAVLRDGLGALIFPSTGGFSTPL